ncbi:MAG: glycoside hydrolase family 2 TIM barrel-domain containing protein [Verrucomicrobiia bacterium]
MGVLLGFASAPLTAAEPATGPRAIIPFDTGWRFHLGDDAAAKQPGFDDASWRRLDLPHDWSIEQPLNPPPDGEENGGFFSHGIGWYRKSFTLPPSTGQKTVIEFDGVYMNSEVWINGHFLGRRPYGFIGFRYDLTDFLNTNGTPNVLAVRVDDSLEPSLRWYAGSGIYRHVRLVTTSFTHFRLDGGVSITTPKITPKQATVEASYIIDAHFFSAEEKDAWAKDVWKAHPTNHEVVLRSSVLAPDGAVVASTESKLKLEDMHPGQHATQQVIVPKPRLWSSSVPELYRLRSTLTLDGQPLDETITTFGIRQLKFDPNRGLLVNGQATKLKGVCLHQDAGSFGNAVPIAVWALRLARLKEMGCNAIRTSHHPFAPEFYDLCDQLGFYVFDEAFDEWTRDWPYNFTENTRGKSKYGYHLYFDQWHATDLRAMLHRDRNHPSVILYSIGNEIPDQFNQDGWRLAKELVAICHEEDPTRPVTSACDQSYVSSRNGFMDTLDIAGYNYIDRLYGTNTYVPERARFPHRLCLGTETSSGLHYWLGVRDHDYVIGDFIWTGIDYLGEAHRFPRRGNDSGFLDLAGGEKPGFYQRAAYWRGDPVLQIFVLTGEKPELAWRAAPAVFKWNWPTNSQITVRAAANCDEVELFLNHQSLGRHAVSQDVYASDWIVPFVPGVLSAVGYRAGQPVATNELSTTGPPARLQVTPLPSPKAGDIAFYEITVVDEASQPVPDATPAVTVKVEGAGRLIGLDTGDLNYGGLFKTATRNAYQGRLLATVQRTAPTGEINVSAVSPELPNAEK